MPKQGTKRCKPFAVQQELALSGGCLREPRVLRVTLIDGMQYVEVGKSVDWVCQVISGSSRSGSPLKCVKMFDDLRKQVHELTSNDDDDDDGVDDDPMSAFISSRIQPKNRKKRNAARQSGCASGLVTATPVQVKLPSGTLLWACIDRGRRPKNHSDASGGKFLVRVDGLVPLLGDLRGDFDKMGVDDRDSDGDDDGGDDLDNAASSLCFTHRDCAWEASVVDQHGERQRKRFYVPKCKPGSKSYLSEDAYAEERERIRQCAHNWLLSHAA